MTDPLDDHRLDDHRQSADGTPHPVPGGHPHPGGQPYPGGQPSPQAAPGQTGHLTQQPVTGGAAWGWGLLAFVPIPLIGQLVAAIVMIAVGGRQRRHGGIVAAQGVRAANWGLTYIVLTVLLLGSAVPLGFLGNAAQANGNPDAQRLLTGIVLVLLSLWLYGLNLVHVVVVIVGMVQASKWKVSRMPVIPFLRERPAPGDSG